MKEAQHNNVPNLTVGSVYWALVASNIPHPHVVIAELTHNLVRVCAITTNRKKINIPGNIVLDPGEGNLMKLSIIEVSKVHTIRCAQLGEYIGCLTPQRVKQVEAGIEFINKTYFQGHHS